MWKHELLLLFIFTLTIGQIQSGVIIPANDRTTEEIIIVTKDLNGSDDPPNVSDGVAWDVYRSADLPNSEIDLLDNQRRSSVGVKQEKMLKITFKGRKHVRTKPNCKCTIRGRCARTVNC